MISTFSFVIVVFVSPGFSNGFAVCESQTKGGSVVANCLGMFPCSAKSLNLANDR